MKSEIIHGDNIEELRKLPANSVDAVVTDAPYGLGKEPDPVAMLQAWITTGYMEVTGGGFMGKAWDAFVPQPAFWKEVFRVLKPGGHVLCFFGTRTYDWGVMAMRIAGFEIRDQVQWLYGSGFPKSLDVSKAIDKQRDDRDDILRVTTFISDAAERAGITRADVDAVMGTTDMGGWWMSRLLHRCQCPKWDQWLKLKEFIGFGDEMDAEVWRLNGRKGQPGDAWQTAEVIGEHEGVTPGFGEHRFSVRDTKIRAASDQAAKWQGWGTALKPANEPIVLARKPLCGTVAANVMQHGTGAINVDACRLDLGDEYSPEKKQKQNSNRITWEGGTASGFNSNHEQSTYNAAGRWPANVIHDGSDEVLKCFPETESGKTLPTHTEAGRQVYGQNAKGGFTTMETYGDSGSAARFFYSAKTSQFERNAGLWGMDKGDAPGSKRSKPAAGRKESLGQPRENFHPTVKPISLMLYLCKLITPPGGVVLDPFVGSGTTGIAAKIGGFQFIGMEREAEYIPIAQARIDWWTVKRWNEYQDGFKPKPEEKKPEEKKESAQPTLF